MNMLRENMRLIAECSKRLIELCEKLGMVEEEKPKYPKTYEECCYVLGFENTELVFEADYKDINPPKEQWKRLGLINQFNKLLICRDAYWKIAGEEMGLGKPWEPSYKKWNEYIDGGKLDKHTIIYDNNEVQRAMTGGTSYILTFPTEEMRDAFYEAFKELIKECKELL